MKKLILLLTIVLLIPASVFASFKKYQGMEIAGYVDSVFSLSVTNLLDQSDWPDSDGINLNYNDTGSKINTYLIAPTNVPLSKAGLKIGTFDLMISFNPTAANGYSSATLTITHTQMNHKTNAGVSFDYELAVSYDINNGNSISKDNLGICYSTTATLSGPEEISIPVVPYNSAAGLCSIKSGGIFFRLTIDNPATTTTYTTEQVNGSYTSTVTFLMETN